MHNKDLFQPLVSRLTPKARIIRSVFSLSNPRGLFIMFFRILPHIVVFSTGSMRVVPRLRHFTKFLHYIVMLNVDHGPLYVCKYMKACHVAIQQTVAGCPPKSLRILEPDFPFPRLRRGLPLFIGSMDRHQIHLGNPRTVRLWLSILSLYRVLDAPRKVKLETITDPFKGSWAQVGSLMNSFRFTARVVKTQNFGLFSVRRLRAERLRFSTAAGPNARYAFVGSLLDALALSRYPHLLEAWRAYAEVTKSKDLITLFDRCLAFARKAYRIDALTASSLRRGNIGNSEAKFILGNFPDIFVEYEQTVKGNRLIYKKITRPGDLHDCEPGKLVGIPEPAGKMRVIALVEIWTQSLFEPLHKTLFSFLRKLPNDGTFDQNAAFERAVRKGLEAKGTYCADLSSATDRLPLVLQQDILNVLFGKRIGDLWAYLLGKRNFILREPLGHYQAGTSFQYGAGQPMGCLSSWAMLAVCHHFILQACCYNLGRSTDVWHTCYEILGDDIVIFDKDVYLEYLQVMTLLDVQTNPSKSLISENGNKVLEFAKRTSLNGVEVSGLSWKQLVATQGWKDIVPLLLSYSDKALIPREGALIGIIKSLLGPRRGTKMFTKVSTRYKPFVNILVSLLNHFSNLGVMDLRSAFRYVVDPRMRGEEAITGDVPCTTLLHDLIICIRSKPHFREFGLWNTSGFRLDRLELRDYLVGAKVLPYWGHGLDRDLIIKMNAMSEVLPILPSRIMEYHLDGTYKIPEKVEQFTELQNEMASLLSDLVISLLNCDEDQERFNTLKHVDFANSLAKRDFATSQRVHKEFNLFLTKYDFIDRLGNRILKQSDFIQWPMADVRLSRDHARAFDYIITRPDKPEDFPLTLSPWQMAYVQKDRRLRSWLGYNTSPRPRV